MFTISVETHFWASHQLHLPDGSKEPSHYHNWLVTVQVAAEKLNEIEINVAEVVDYLRITGQFTPALREVVERKFTAEEAKRRGIVVTDEELQQAADGFRFLHDLSKASDTEEWLKSTGTSLETFEQHLETNILMSKLKDELENKADKAPYLSSSEIQESVREMIFQEWLADQLK